MSKYKQKPVVTPQTIGNKPVIVHYWYSNHENITGLAHQQELPADQLSETILKLIQQGFYVMVKVFDESIMLAIDTSRFTQR